jgi:hypothetical protein
MKLNSKHRSLTRAALFPAAYQAATVRESVTCALLLLIPALAFGQAHRAEQDREIRYWLLDPATHKFSISHDFTVDCPGQAWVHSFVRAGSEVAPDSKITLLDTGETLHTHIVSGKDVNALGKCVAQQPPDEVVVQGDLPGPIMQGQSSRVRVEETYTDPVGYTMKGAELVWTRTVGRPLNFVTLPDGWMLTGVNTPAVVTLDAQGRVTLRFTNTHPGDLAVTIKAKKR